MNRRVTSATDINGEQYVAHTAYADRQKACQALLKDITARLAQHAEAEARQQWNWGFSGDLARVETQLQGIMESLGAGSI